MAKMNRMEQVAYRMRVAQERGIPKYEVVMDQDRARDAFDSEHLYNLFSELPIDVQKRVEIGAHYTGSFDGFSPVLVGPYALAHYGNWNAPLPETAVYVTDYFDRFKCKILQPLVDLGLIEAMISDQSVSIPRYGCIVYAEEAIMRAESARFRADLVKILGYNRLVLPIEVL